MSLAFATAFAPASVGNVAVGFDILGFSVDALGDKVTARRAKAPGVAIRSVTGVAGPLPMKADENTAGRALETMLEAAKAPFGLEIEIEKGIPLGSGLGGSAASAVAAVVAANTLMEQPFEGIELLKFAIEGEAVASGARHADNVAPSLFGGLVLAVGVDAPRIIRIPAPGSLRAVLVKPAMSVETKHARAILSPTVGLSDFVRQSANLAGFIAGCYTDDVDLIRASFEDVIIEPQRRTLIPGFAEAQAGAFLNGAVGCSISGAGPTIFALAPEKDAPAVRAAMRSAFEKSDSWIVDIKSAGARLV